MATIADGVNGGRDNFLLLRLLAASLVMYGHAPAITGGQGWPDIFVRMGWGSYSGDLAVDVFFVVSGFMIAGSYLRRRHLADFLWARLLRIYPAYIACLLGSAFVLGAACTAMPLHDYYRSHDVLHYVSKNIELGKGMAWELPGVFRDNPKLAVVNGSIWTLPAEVRMYLWVALAGVLGILSRRWCCNLLLAALLVCGLLAPAHVPLVPLASFLRLAGCFALGVFCWVNGKRVPVGWWCVAALGLLAWLLRATPLYPFVFSLALAAFVFAFGYASPWLGCLRFGDYSYGLYLWGYPMQQLVAHLAPQLSHAGNVLLAWPLAMLLAMLSWHLVERPVLRLKSISGVVQAKARSALGRLRTDG
ncbi:acyltransferase [Rhodanobacter sp. DHG33]|uniref:acyltransferase family protein n=1 Tax=Rhodanobacter sp. DHG33 TaxID=2775921 RepID=UPI00177FE1B4|nr:acyltransferase [Rhodanobacter sp. DHG33]MBD8898008.1 acyltransferase [Rhodanobacter sp. DHG33]